MNTEIPRWLVTLLILMFVLFVQSYTIKRLHQAKTEIDVLRQGFISIFGILGMILMSLFALVGK